MKLLDKEKLLYSVILLEDGVKTYDCELCGKSYLESGSMERHLKDHGDEIK